MARYLHEANKPILQKKDSIIKGIIIIIMISEKEREREREENGSGFLITCDKNKQKQAIKDAYNFLNEYIQEIYGDIQSKIIHKQLERLGKQNTLANQIEIRSTLKNRLRVLSSVQTNVNVYIQLSKINESITQFVIDPLRVVTTMMKDIHESDRQLTRYCHKILPVERSFKAQHFKMLDEIESLFQKRDNSSIKSWALNFKCRNNSKFNYKQVLAKCDQIAKKYGHFTDIYYPQWTVAVEIANHLMCLSIIEGYKQYDEFRLHKKGRKIEGQKKQIIQVKKVGKQREYRQRQIRQKQPKKVNQNKQTNNKQKQDGFQEKQKKEEPNKEQKLDEQKMEISVVSKLLNEKIQVADEDVDFI